MRGVTARFSRDDGMTIIEVMIAATILFIVLTGILSLLMQTLAMGMQSKEKAVFNNAVNSYIERVQAMPFENVVIGAGTGELSAEETIAVGAYTITITPTITPGATSDLKTLVVTATLTSANGRTSDITTDVVIRNKASFLTQGVNGPEVTWTTGVMPDEGEVVWSYTKASGGALWLAAEATAAEGRTISRVVLSADNGWPLQNISGTEAVWDIDTADREQSWSLTGFAWNTAQEGIIDAETLEVGPVIPDGLRTISIDVTDSGGGRTERTYTFIVDNNKPSAPGVPALELSASGPTLTWAPSSDGTDPVTSYRLSLTRRSPDGVMVWVPQPDVVLGTNKLALEPFARYVATVRAIGIAPNQRQSDPAVLGKSVITPPRASGTWASANGNASGTAALTVTPPTFRYLDTPVYKWYSSPSPTGPWTTVVGTTASVSAAYSAPSYFRCFVTLTPGWDYDSTTTPLTTFASSVIGPTGPKKTSGTLAEQWLP